MDMRHFPQENFETLVGNTNIKYVFLNLVDSVFGILH